MRHYWTPQEDAQLAQMYADESLFAEDIAKRLGLSVGQVYNRAQLLRLHRPEGIAAKAGKLGTLHPSAMAHRFKKGDTPANKGKKMSAEVYAKVAATMFKPGNKPVNHRTVGSERVNKDGYVEVKVAEPRTWKLKHRVIWEQANGPIPKGYNIQFKDHNPLNCVLDNLRIISRVEQMRDENCAMARYPKELVDVIRLRGALKRRINKETTKTRQQ